jgi:tetratricopeptide (TPR) repeat protein
LTSDYNFAQIKIQHLDDLGALLGIIFYFSLAVYCLLNFRKRGIVVFGTLFFLISLAPVSNIFFLGGSSMAERFMYIPSLGFCIVVAYFLIKFTKAESIKWQSNLTTFLSAHSTLFLILLSVTILYSIKTLSRSKDWKDTLTVYSQDIQVSKNSATANELLGNALVLQVAKSPNKKDQSDTFNLAKRYLKRALEIAPGFFNASSNLGYIYLVENKPDSAYQYLHEGSKNGADDIQLNYYYGSALFLLRKYDSAINILNHTIQLNEKYVDAYLMLASSYLGKGDVNGGLSCYSKVMAIDPNNPKAYYLAAGILRSKGDTLKAKQYMDKALSLGYNSH